MMPLLSVVVPTRNRDAYLLDCVATAIRHCPSAEVVVCDNSDTDALRHRLSGVLGSGKLKYSHHGGLRSVVDNFESALELAAGDYVLFLGDDDAVGPGLEQVVNWAARNDIDAVISYGDRFLVSYFWPGTTSKYFGTGYSAKLFVDEFSGKALRIDATNELRRVASRFGGGLGRLPRAYHGLVSRELLHEIKARHGHVFGGVSPDIFSAAMIAAHCRNAYQVDYPFVIPGASPASTAGQGAARSDRAALGQTDHIARFGDGLVWDDRIPEFYAPQTVWAFSLLSAIKELDVPGIQPSFARLYARCLLYCRPYWRQSLQPLLRLENRRDSAILAVRVLAGIAMELGEQSVRIMRRAVHPRAGGRARGFPGLVNISAAYEVLADDIRRNGRALQLPGGRE